MGEYEEGLGGHKGSTDIGKISKILHKNDQYLQLCLIIMLLFTKAISVIIPLCNSSK